MDDDCKIDHFGKMFSNCKIVWNIENFCFAISTEDNYIHSPEFKLKGIQVTRWRMATEVKWTVAKDGYISMCLERLSHPGPDVVWVNCEIIAIAGLKQYAPIEYSHFFDQNAKKEVRLQSLKDILSHLIPLEPDTFTIECTLIVREQDKIVKMLKPAHLGIQTLSEDLKKIFKDTKYQDVTLRIQEQDIKAHKVVLSRNKILRCLIAKTKNDVVELQNLNYEDVLKFISFMYSGNMEHILASPSISMYKCMEFFSCDDLLRFFAPEQVNMHTKIEAVEYELHWVINAFSEREEKCISSPFFKGINGSTTWQLHLDTDTEGNEGYFSIFAVIVEGTKPKYFCLEFAIEDVNGLISFPNRILRFNNCYDDMGFKEFVERSSLENSTKVIDGTLNILFKVRTSTGGQRSSLGSRIMSFITPPKESIYDKLSSEMEDLLSDARFSDVTLQSGNEKFRVHKCVLSVRSPMFYRIFQETSSNIIVFSLIKPNVLRILLRYLYTGVLENIELSDLLQLYKASVSFSIPVLKEMCVKRLKEKITSDTMNTVLDMANKLGQKSLVLEMIRMSLSSD